LELSTPKKKNAGKNVTYTPNANPNGNMMDHLKSIRRDVSEWSSEYSRVEMASESGKSSNVVRNKP
jgi:hypothetical protein